MGCGREETKPTRASLRSTPAPLAWPRLMHKHTLKSCEVCLQTQEDGGSRASHHGDRTGAPINISGTVDGAQSLQRPLR